MKKILIPLLGLVMVVSCADDNNTIDSSNVTDNSKITADTANRIESNEFTKNILGDNFMASDGKTLAPTIKERMIAEFTAANKKAPTVHGPYTATVAVPGANPTDVKISYAQVGSTYPGTGVYMSDVYNYYLRAQLPAEAATGWIDSVDNPGYSNYTTQTIGFNSNMSTANGNKYVVANTYTMVLKHNMVGQLINAVVPAASGPKTFTYYYLTL
ncbi:hypothetical protein [Chryseobacterium turcicum]|uniref:Uncharacterized protein n=1 Tax=Chryseobacterium turcicum TaxID=2898076 RepID=A0A9Q3YU76_9FLAO|nr:hypothetical protein [Chryseobacterium turcicum]MCD1115679.1 hypothetical protein [Chryseobacterium turcicum]